MLRRSGRSVQEQFPRWTEGLEISLGQALQQVFESELRISFCKFEAPAEISERGLHFRLQAGGEISLAIEAGDAAVDRAELFSRLVRLVAHFNRLSPGSLIPLPARQCLSAHTAAFSLLSAEQSVRGRVLVSASEPLELPSRPLAEQRCCSAKARVSVEVLMPLGSGIQGGRAQVRADVRISSPVLSRIFWGRLAEQSNHVQLFIEKEGKRMESGPETKLPVTLSLGELELSFEDLMRLRPGMCLEFERPRLFEAMLLLGGCPWAPARVEIREREVLVGVVGPVMESDGNTSAPEATFCPDSRLTS